MFVFRCQTSKQHTAALFEKRAVHSSATRRCLPRAVHTQKTTSQHSARKLDAAGCVTPNTTLPGKPTHLHRRSPKQSSTDPRTLPWPTLPTTTTRWTFQLERRAPSKYYSATTAVTTASCCAGCWVWGIGKLRARGLYAACLQV